MNTLLKNIFGRPENTADKNTNNHSQPAGPQSQQDTAESATRRQLVQSLLQLVLRRNGMPGSWVEAHILILSSRTRGSIAQLKLVLKHGDERLLQYIFAIQKELQKELLVTDPTSASWLNGVTWQLDIDNSCSRAVLPDRSFWQPVIAVQEARNQPARKPAPPIAAPAAPAAPAAASQPASPAATRAGHPAHAAHAAHAAAPAARPAAPAPVVARPPVAAAAAPVAAMPAAPAQPPMPARPLSAQMPAPIPAAQQMPQRPAQPQPHQAAARPAPVSAPAPAVSPSGIRIAPPARPTAPPRSSGMAAPAAAPSRPSPAASSKPAAKVALDYGAPNFECSRPAEETDLTPELARLFSLNDEEWRAEVKKQVSAVGYENTQPFRKPGK